MTPTYTPTHNTDAIYETSSSQDMEEIHSRPRESRGAALACVDRSSLAACPHGRTEQCFAGSKPLFPRDIDCLSVSTGWHDDTHTHTHIRPTQLCLACRNFNAFISNIWHHMQPGVYRLSRFPVEKSNLFKYGIHIMRLGAKLSATGARATEANIQTHADGGRGQLCI